MSAAIGLPEGQQFRAFHTFIRGARRFMESETLARTRADYVAAGGEADTADEGLAMLDRSPGFQMYSWMFRNFQRFKYLYPEWGIIPAAQPHRGEIESALEAAAARGISSGHLRLNPDIAYPDYYRHVDFHQHPGGVWSDSLDGLVYDVARQTTIPAHLDSMAVYRLLFEALPKDRSYDRVLDWGTGHGGGLLTWMHQHPNSEAYGVDLSAPCLKFTWANAGAQGLTPLLSQQDVAHLDYPDNHFDLLFFVFMLHEIPPAPTPEILREVKRVLKPGGLFFGMEFRPSSEKPFEQVMANTLQWANDEVFAPAFFKFPFQTTALQMGFKRAEIRRFDAMYATPKETGSRGPVTEFTIFDFEK